MTPYQTKSLFGGGHLMSFKEKRLYCIDCKQYFSFSIEEQEFHAAQGFINEPRRCKSCRQAKKSDHTEIETHGEDNSSQRQMFPVVCTKCGKSTRVPFQPHEDKSVFCSDCYIKTRMSK
jgi:CxxC-x17-CxxC domain-containing protein